ncbi:MAG: hypothetical protein H0X33_06905 [Taibaiella sp.]|nr:hypothetical protein [Taibaiella sp.]
MLYRIAILTLMFISFSVAYAQGLTPIEADRIRKLACEMERQDQAVRDSLQVAKKEKDSIAIRRWQAELYITDKRNFSRLQTLIDTIGFPCPQLLGKGTCYPFAILIHWSKEYPEWFNDPAQVIKFKREIQKGHLPKSQIDLAQFFYISFMAADLKYFKLVNDARIAYGLKPYTKKQYQKQERLEPMMEDNEKPASRNSN